MKTRENFNKQYPQLNKRQQSSGYMLSEIEGWKIEITEPSCAITLTKEGKTLTMQENGCAL